MGPEITEKKIIYYYFLTTYKICYSRPSKDWQLLWVFTIIIYNYNFYYFIVMIIMIIMIIIF